MNNVEEDEGVMPHERELVQAYRQLEEHASRMACLAKQENWETLIDEQAGYTRAVDRIADLEQRTGLDDGGRKVKYALLERILQHDLEVRTRLVARREELAQRIAVSRRESVLNRTYGNHGGALAPPPPDHETPGS